jgi:hypothetical protein
MHILPRKVFIALVPNRTGFDSREHDPRRSYEGRIFLSSLISPCVTQHTLVCTQHVFLQGERLHPSADEAESERREISVIQYIYGCMHFF